jgi:hypothetical protein
MQKLSLCVQVYTVDPAIWEMSKKTVDPIGKMYLRAGQRLMRLHTMKEDKYIYIVKLYMLNIVKPSSFVKSPCVLAKFSLFLRS